LGKSQLLVLSNGIVDNAFMCADFLPVQGEERTWLGLIGKDALYGLCISSVGHKANVLAVRLVGIDEAAFFGNFPGMGLFIVAQRKLRVGELFLREVIQDIALVFFWIFGAEQFIAAIAFPYAGVMTGDDGVAAQFLCPFV